MAIDKIFYDPRPLSNNKKSFLFQRKKASFAEPSLSNTVSQTKSHCDLKFFTNWLCKTFDFLL